MLRQVHPDLSISLAAARAIAHMDAAILDRLAAEIPVLVDFPPTSSVVSYRTVLTALRLTFDPRSLQLCQHAMSELMKAVQRYNKDAAVISPEPAVASPTSPAHASTKAGLSLSVADVAARLARRLPGYTVTLSAAVAMAAISEYLIAEILELAGNAAKDEKSPSVLPRFVVLAVRGDEELDVLYNGVIVGGGNIPLLPLIPQREATMFSNEDALFGELLGQARPLDRKVLRRSTAEDGISDNDVDEEKLAVAYETDESEGDEGVDNDDTAFGSSAAIGRVLLATASGGAPPTPHDQAIFAAASEDDTVGLDGLGVAMLPRLLAGSRAAAVIIEGSARVVRSPRSDSRVNGRGEPIRDADESSAVTLGDCLTNLLDRDLPSSPPWAKYGWKWDAREAFTAACDAKGTTTGAALLSAKTLEAAELARSFIADVDAHESGRALVDALCEAATSTSDDPEHKIVRFKPTPADVAFAVQLEDEFAVDRIADVLGAVKAAELEAAAEAVGYAPGFAAAELHYLLSASAAGTAAATADQGPFPTALRARLSNALARADAAEALLENAADREATFSCVVLGEGTTIECVARAIGSLGARIIAAPRAPRVALLASARNALRDLEPELKRVAAVDVMPDAEILHGVLRAYKRVARVFARSGDTELVHRAEVFFDRLAAQRVREGFYHTARAWGLSPPSSTADSGEVLPLGAMTALVAEVAQEYKTDLHIDPDAVAALAAAAEAHLVGLFIAARRHAHAAGRETLLVEDMRAAGHR